MKLLLLLLSTLYLISCAITGRFNDNYFYRGEHISKLTQRLNRLKKQGLIPRQDSNTVFIQTRKTCHTSSKCQNWRRGIRDPLWQQSYCKKGRGHKTRGHCKYAVNPDVVSDLAQEKTYDQLLGYDTVDLAIVLGFGGILGAVGAYLFNKEGNNAKF